MRSWQQLVFFYRKAALLKAVSSVNSAESLWPWRKHPRKKAVAARRCHSRTQYISTNTIYIIQYTYYICMCKYVLELHKQQPLVALAFMLIAALLHMQCSLILLQLQWLYLTVSSLTIIVMLVFQILSSDIQYVNQTIA